MAGDTSTIRSGLAAPTLKVAADVSAKAGDANILRATLRVTFCGAFAMALTAGIGARVGTAV